MQRATVDSSAQKEQLPQVSSQDRSYWSTWWDETFPKFSEDTKKRIYQQVRLAATASCRKGAMRLAACTNGTHLLCCPVCAWRIYQALPAA